MNFTFWKTHQRGTASILLSVFFSQWCLSSYSQIFQPVSKPFYVTSRVTTPYFKLNTPVNTWFENPPFSPLTEGVVAGSEKDVNEIMYAPKAGPGPGQPEMQSFQSLSSSNMVDLFTGDFSYTIPLLDVGGYPLNIHYRSGITMDQESSWVGLGWNINPGTISRNMRGLPDDFNGEDQVTKINAIKPNWTAGGNMSVGMETIGLDAVKLQAGLSGSIFYNNYKGLGISAGTSLNFSASQAAKGSFTTGMSLESNSQSGVSISPSFEVTFKNAIAETYGILSSGYSVSSAYSTRSGLQALTIGSKGVLKDRSAAMDNKSSSGPTISGDLVNISFAHQAYTPSTNIPFTSYQFSFHLKPGAAVTVLHPYYSFGGFFSRQYIAESDQVQKFPAFGYLHFQKAKNVADAMLDFNREKELTYRSSPPTPHIAVPQYTYDIYSVTAEGTGGMFRPYRSDIGFVRDAEIRSRSSDGSLSLDIGSGNLVHAGYDVRFNSASNQNSAWIESNLLESQLPFKESDSSFEAVYFKNPGEKSIQPQMYFDKLGDTDPVMAVMSEFDDPVLSPFLQRYKNKLPLGNKIKVDATNTLKHNRDKRTQVISYLTAEDASQFGLDKKLLIYPVNSFFAGKCDENICSYPMQPGCDTKIIAISRVSSTLRKKHHLSEITVLNPDGKRYVYGLPVYNTYQKEVSFSVNRQNADITTGHVSYNPGTDNSTGNKQGKDNFYSAEEMPGYAHSFLLTGIVSPDYVDKTGDGISDDDMGDAVKFNYTRLYGENTMFRWRTPIAENKAAYNEGLKTDKSDDKGSYIYGEKEIWYLHSLESKSMLVTFTLSDPAKREFREDAAGVKNENGGRDNQQPLRYLKQIDLYSKSDFIKNKDKARPIKSVHFEYNYELCEGNPSSSEGKGKLTLKKIWFTYNNNNKGQKNPYVFLYHPQDANNKNSAPSGEYNPRYDPKGYDRWGAYKNGADNPGCLSNTDYPYTLQTGTGGDSTKAAKQVASWTLSDIIVPSGGRMNIQYESDDYAFVQNKRAMQMCALVGMGKTEKLSEKKNTLYGGLDESYKDYLYAFIKIPSAIQATNTADQKREILNKYLQGVEKLYFRMRVDMPGDIYGDGDEHVSTYARFEDYGVSTDKQIIWLKLQGTDHLKGDDGNASPLAKTAIQTLSLNLSSKAYPNSDLDGELDPPALVRSVSAMMLNLSELFINFPTQARIRGWAKKLNTEQSFVRLNNPSYKKFGDGHRVKRITIYDNWATMTGGAEQEASYGQEYDYTTTLVTEGVKTTISSGVASYEPMIGNDENPFRQPIEYKDQIAPMAPVNNMYSEHPLGEAFFPSASVGYSKVRIHTIHYKDIKSANGYQESEFYTTYDFPTRVEHTPLEKRVYKSENLLNILNLYSKKALSFSQGFSIELNDMNGKAKGNANYPENDPYNAIAYTKYYYQVEDENAIHKQLSNTVTVIDSANGHIKMNAAIGKEIELMADMRQQEFISRGAAVELNVDGFMIGPIPVTIPMPWVKPHYELNRFRSAAVTKVVQRYGILKKVMVYEKGSTVTTENLLYDGETGDVLLTETQNEFNDPVYQFQYPAHWAYSGMSGAYSNINAIFKNVSIRNGKIVSAAGYRDIEKYFESGDEIIVSGGMERQSEINGVDACTGFGICNEPVMGSTVTKTIWAVHASKIEMHKGLKGIYFIDEHGKFFTGENNELRILRSGKRNMPAISIGTVVSLKNPLQQIAGQWKLVLDESTKVTQTAAASYNDFWKVEDAKYRPLSMTEKKSAVKKLVLNPLPEYTFSISKDYRSNRVGGGNSAEYYRAFTNSPYFEVSEKLPPRGTSTRISHELESWMKFDLRELPSNASIVNASLSLYPHLEQHTETRGGAYANDRNHSPDKPHLKGETQKANESYLYLDFDTSLTFLNPLTLSDESEMVKKIFRTTNQLSPVYSTILSTHKENSFLIDIGNLVKLTLNRTDKQHTWFRMRGIGAAKNGSNKLCFWSANSRSMDCSVYGPPNPQQTIYNNGTANSVLANTPCPSCSNVGTGIGKEFCNTAPQLTIEYISCEPGYTLIQECDSFYCVRTTLIDTCLSRISDTATNPYRWGILGNWRLEKNYTYYNNRTETQITDDHLTNIREYGTINGFKPFWKFRQDGISATKDTTHWVWNSMSTLVNRKGFELENTDPLGRYNSAQYGYNEAMPVAVTQNSRYNEQAYDGFEDYNYHNEACTTACKIQSHVDINPLRNLVSNEEAHSGLYSLGVPGGSSATITAKLENPLSSGTSPFLLFNSDTADRGTIKRVANGTGLKATVYKGYDYKNDNYGLDQYNYSGFRIPMQPPKDYYGLNIDYNKITGSSLGLNRFTINYKIVWEGYLTLRKTSSATTTDPEGEYKFSVSAANSFKLWIDDKLLLNAFPNDPVYFNNSQNTSLFSKSVKLYHGKVYKIRVEHTAGTGLTALASLAWIKPSTSRAVVIPKTNFHSSQANAEATINKQTTRCISWEGVRTSPTTIYNEFAPVAGNKYIVSAWVKEQRDCKCENYENASVTISFHDRYQNAAGPSAVLRPSGNIIEGWQRIEEVITIPVGTVSTEISFVAASQNGNTGKIYFDDWRFVPYNGNMKSFVYNAINLRLMAELDENNYASFYEYDDDGTLIRVKKETERGIKTIKETRSALRKE